MTRTYFASTQLRCSSSQDLSSKVSLSAHWGNGSHGGVCTPRIFLLRMIHELMEVALHRPVAARRVRGEPTACAHGDLGRLLHRLHREIFGRLDDDIPLATDP